MDLFCGIDYQNATPCPCWSSTEVHSWTPRLFQSWCLFQPKAMESRNLPKPPDYSSLSVGLYPITQPKIMLWVTKSHKLAHLPSDMVTVSDHTNKMMCESLSLTSNLHPIHQGLWEFSVETLREGPPHLPHRYGTTTYRPWRIAAMKATAFIRRSHMMSSTLACKL